MLRKNAKKCSEQNLTPILTKNQITTKKLVNKRNRFRKKWSMEMVMMALPPVTSAVMVHFPKVMLAEMFQQNVLLQAPFSMAFIPAAGRVALESGLHLAFPFDMRAIVGLVFEPFAASLTNEACKIISGISTWKSS